VGLDGLVELGVAALDEPAAPELALEEGEPELGVGALALGA
jgi:hypothetical protein